MQQDKHKLTNLQSDSCQTQNFHFIQLVMSMCLKEANEPENASMYTQLKSVVESHCWPQLIKCTITTTGYKSLSNVNNNNSDQKNRAGGMLKGFLIKQFFPWTLLFIVTSAVIKTWRNTDNDNNYLGRNQAKQFFDSCSPRKIHAVSEWPLN